MARVIFHQRFPLGLCYRIFSEVEVLTDCYPVEITQSAHPKCSSRHMAELDACKQLSILVKVIPDALYNASDIHGSRSLFCCRLNEGSVGLDDFIFLNGCCL